MTPIVNLHILAKRFTQLSNSAYFDRSFREFASKIVEVVDHVIVNENKYPDIVVRQLEAHVWRVMQFVRGSRSNDAPHETQYVLRKALSDWINHPALISNASLEYFGFFLDTNDIWDFIERSLNLFDSKGYKPLVVRIGSPEVLKHRPLFCIPLFHELGHFVDLYYEISQISLILHPPKSSPSHIPPKQIYAVNLNHRREYFADLFGACYAGEASINSLQSIAPNDPDSFTHPSTANRVRVVNAFLHKKQDPMIDILQDSIKRRTKRKLKLRYKEIKLDQTFDDVLTYKIKNDSELFGIYLSGWKYLENQLRTTTAPWAIGEVTTYQIEKTINDLVEKSIRNYEVGELWRHVPTD